jgi:hypothetical protein
MADDLAKLLSEQTVAHAHRMGIHKAIASISIVYHQARASGYRALEEKCNAKLRCLFIEAGTMTGEQYDELSPTNPDLPPERWTPLISS